MTDIGLIALDSGERLALRGVQVSSRISALLAQTALTQQYQNDTDTNLELVYTFPLPTDATLLSFAVAIGDARFQGQVVPRRQAEVVYEQAIGEGNTAFRLQEIRAGLYCTTLGNVMPGERIEITLTYAETLAWNGKRLRYRLPTTVAPRYGDPIGMQPWQRPATILDADYSFQMRVVIAGVLARSTMTCPSHQVRIRSEEDEVTVILANRATLDRDFVLDIENKHVRSMGAVAVAQDTRVAMLTLLSPEIAPQDGGRDVVLVIDCSGSMQGDSLRLAKEGIHLALGSLQPQERFGLVAFGTRSIQLDRALQPANRKNLDLARRWVDGLSDLGGTDIDGALTMALSLSQEPSALDILLLTDGQDWQAGTVSHQARAKGARIFSVGIGAAVAEDAVRSVAEVTEGACELIMPNEDMSERIYRHFCRMRQPRLTRISIAWPCAPQWEARPQHACFAGDAYTVFAALPQALAGTVAVTCAFADESTQTIDIPLEVDPTNDEALVRMAARQRLSALNEVESAAWAVQYQLISKATDYLITMERAMDDKPSALPALQVQPHMLPAGWGGTSTTGPLPLSGTLGGGVVSAARFDDLAMLVVLRRSAQLDMPHDNGYMELLRALQARSRRRLRTGLPMNCEQLLGLPLPEPLAALIEELLRSHGDAEIIQAFYHALLEHAGRDLLDARFGEKAQALIGTGIETPELVLTLKVCLDELWKNRNFGAEFDRYSIPAFLRRQAD